jgi:isoquinoline 1-oxidoreductase alpha subunit
MTRMTVNGEAVHYRLDPQTPLLWALRDASNLTGAKYGCADGTCGACTVIVDGRAATSCTVTIAAMEGSDITTIEGLSSDRAHPVQQAWAAEQVSQCGFCDPGFIMAVAALLQASPNPSAEQIDALPNLCPCGAYPRIRKAILRAAQAMGGSTPIAPAPLPDSTKETVPPQTPTGGQAGEPQPVISLPHRFSGG